MMLRVFVFFLFATTGLAFAQDRAVISKTATPSLGERSGEVQRLLARNGEKTKSVYALEIKGDLADGYTQLLEPETVDERRDNSMKFRASGTMSTGVVILLILATLILWMRFGGAGMLMAKPPQPSTRKPVAAPDAWNIPDGDQIGDPRSLIDQIAAMPDRSAALMRLLRHCLLQAAGETDTRLARADTERSALRRLPSIWPRTDALSDISRQAELAHYGGRPVEDHEFHKALELGRTILTAKKARHA